MEQILKERREERQPGVFLTEEFKEEEHRVAALSNKEGKCFRCDKRGHLGRECQIGGHRELEKVGCWKRKKGDVLSPINPDTMQVTVTKQVYKSYLD